MDVVEAEQTPMAVKVPCYALMVQAETINKEFSRVIEAADVGSTLGRIVPLEPGIMGELEKLESNAHRLIGLFKEAAR